MVLYPDCNLLHRLNRVRGGLAHRNACLDIMLELVVARDLSPTVWIHLCRDGTIPGHQSAGRNHPRYHFSW